MPFTSVRGRDAAIAASMALSLGRRIAPVAMAAAAGEAAGGRASGGGEDEEGEVDARGK